MSVFILYIVSTVLFMQLFRLSQHRYPHVFGVVAVNYIVASLCSVAWWYWHADSPIGQLALALGCVNGLVYWVHLLVLLACYRTAGVGVTVAVMSCSCVMPVLCASIWWGDQLDVFQWLAVALVPIAVLLLSPRGKAMASRWTWQSLLLALNFLLASTSATIHKAVDVWVDAGEKDAYNMILFGGAALFSVAYVWFRGHRPDRSQVQMGLLIGLVNTTTLIFLIASLAVLSTAVVFPVGGTLIIVINVLVSRLLWHEKLTSVQWVGLGLAVAVVGLIAQ